MLHFNLEWRSSVFPFVFYIVSFFFESIVCFVCSIPFKSFSLINNKNKTFKKWNEKTKNEKLVSRFFNSWLFLALKLFNTFLRFNRIELYATALFISTNQLITNVLFILSIYLTFYFNLRSISIRVLWIGLRTLLSFVFVYYNRNIY